MSEAKDVPPLDRWIVDQLIDGAEDMVDRWIEILRRRLGVRPSRLLPTHELRDHMPSVLRDIARYVGAPIESARNMVADRLRLLAELRREQGYGIEEIVVEFEQLSGIVFDTLAELIDDYPGTAQAGEVVQVCGRLQHALWLINRVTIGTYENEEVESRQQLARRMAEFTRVIVHELRGPLNAATASARMIEDGDSAHVDDLVEVLVRSLGRMDGLIEDIGELAMGESAQADRRWVTLAEVVHMVYEEVGGRAEKKSVRLESADDLPDIRVDAATFEIALMNLVANAVKYADPEKEERWVRVSAEPAPADGPFEGGWVVHVRDNGLGIPMALQNQVFQRHFRAHPERAEGTGLGLAITHYVMTQRGGAIAFESSEGEGTVFHLSIPERRPALDHG